ncbi:MAG TPA: GAF domain-containing protein, partial [Roseiflexaceae bacterium]
MSEPLIAEAETSSELIDVFAETPWPSLLLSAGGQILALNRAICELLGIDETAAIGKPVDLFVLDQDRARVRALFKQAVSGNSSMSIRAHLRRPGRAPLTAELEAIAVSDDPAGRVTLVVHPCSLPDRRERLLLELNRLAPALLTAQSPEQVFSRAAQALVPLGIGMAVALFDPDRAMLRLTSATVNSAVTNFLIKAAGFRHTNMPIPLTIPGFGDALTERKAIFWTDPRAILQEIVPPPVVGICQRLLRIQGIRGFIFAPILAGEQVYGVLTVWSYPLSVDDVPFIEAFGHQIAAVLAQIDLRRRMETQIQRLDSLAAT